MSRLNSRLFLQASNSNICSIDKIWNVCYNLFIVREERTMFEPEAYSEEFEDLAAALCEVEDEPDEGDTPMGIEDDCPLDGDAESALASIGWGTDEDYGYYGGGEEW
jgi:hypothetical protein